MKKVQQKVNSVQSNPPPGNKADSGSAHARREKAQALNRTLAKHLSPQKISRLARQTGFQVRVARKLTPWLLVQSACLLVTQSQISFRLWALLLGLVGRCTLSKQALAERMTGRAVCFLQEVLSALLTSVARLSDRLPAKLLRPFPRVLIEDSTGLPLAPRLARHFPGPANQHKKKKQGYLKIQSCFDLRSHLFVHFSLSSFRRNDQAAAGDVLAWIRSGDLLIRDLGYLVIPVLEQLRLKGAYYLSRLRSDSQLWEPGSPKPLDLLARLRHQGSLDAQWELGRAREPVRVVALPVSCELAAERRRKARQNRDRRCHPNHRYLALLSWTILITNVPREIWPPAAVAQAYGLRWRIETVFKAWKSHLHLRDLSPTASAAEVEAIIYAKLLFITLMAVCWWRPALFRAGPSGQAPSLLKLTQMLASLLLAVLLAELEINAEHALRRQLHYHGCYDTRKRRHFFDQFLFSR